MKEIATGQRKMAQLAGKGATASFQHSNDSLCRAVARKAREDAGRCKGARGQERLLLKERRRSQHDRRMYKQHIKRIENNQTDTNEPGQSNSRDADVSMKSG